MKNYDIKLKFRMVKPRVIEGIALFEDLAPQKWGAFSFVKTNVCRCENVLILGENVDKSWKM